VWAAALAVRVREVARLCRISDTLGAANTPETRYAKSGDVHIAYEVWGEGPFDLVWVGGPWSPTVEFTEMSDEGPESLTGVRLIRFDKRGLGASDRVAGVPSLEERMDDVRAVMDEAGSETAALLGRPSSRARAAAQATRVELALPRSSRTGAQDGEGERSSSLGQVHALPDPAREPGEGREHGIDLHGHEDRHLTGLAGPVGVAE